MSRLRGSSRVLPHDREITSLPVRLGGLGLLSHEEVAPHARAAMSESADHILWKALTFADASLEDKAAAPPLPASFRAQSVRCQAAFAERREALLGSLSIRERVGLIDRSSPIARKWLSTIPYHPHLRLSDVEVSAGLHDRTLCPGQEDHCSCGGRNVFGHDEVCPTREHFRVSRHEKIKELFCRHIKSISRTSAVVEPFLPGSQRRADIRVTGPGAHRGAVADYDLTVVNSSQVDSLIPSSGAHPSGSLPAFPIASTGLSALHRHLTSAESRKRAQYRGQIPTVHPLVISTSGTLSPASEKIVDHWRKLMTGSSYSHLTSSISLSLVRSRTKSFAL